MSFSIFLKMPVLMAPLLLCSCYTLGQAYQQARLLWQREDLSEVLMKQDETKDRLEKLQWVPRILSFAQADIGLRPGDSYTSYVRLPEGTKALTWVVQAANPRKLERKTWWFPIVGSQPYLGFFDPDEAKAFQSKLREQGYDTRLGGVDAFSLLGYLSDPVYSTMIDGRSLAEVVDLLIHESVHRTLYVPDQSTFNESFADFVAKRATVDFLRKHAAEIDSAAADSEQFLKKAQLEIESGKRFRTFLTAAFDRLEKFYEQSEKSAELQDQELFLKARAQFFQTLENDYSRDVRPQVVGSSYEEAFRAERMNNAVLLGYSLYEARHEPFESVLLRSGGNLQKMISLLEGCLKADWKSDGGLEGPRGAEEERIWSVIATCGGVADVGG